MSKDKTAAERNRKLREREKKEGFIRVEVKVPTNKKQDLISYAKGLRKSPKS